MVNGSRSISCWLAVIIRNVERARLLLLLVLAETRRIVQQVCEPEQSEDVCTLALWRVHWFMIPSYCSSPEGFTRTKAYNIFGCLWPIRNFRLMYPLYTVWSFQIQSTFASNTSPKYGKMCGLLGHRKINRRTHKIVHVLDIVHVRFQRIQQKPFAPVRNALSTSTVDGQPSDGILGTAAHTSHVRYTHRFASRTHGPICMYVCDAFRCVRRVRVFGTHINCVRGAYNVISVWHCRWCCETRSRFPEVMLELLLLRVCVGRLSPNAESFRSLCSAESPGSWYSKARRNTVGGWTMLRWRGWLLSRMFMLVLKFERFGIYR